jgi:hypothetical protein
MAQFTSMLPRWLRFALMLGVLTVVLLQVDAKLKMVEVRLDPKYFLGLERGGILLGNEPQWVDTVERTALFLERQLEPGELFFALPYEPLYYYLLGRPSPTYQYAFFDYMLIPPQQDAQTVADLIEKNVRWVLFSNRIITQEGGLGTFGVTNSPLLGKYLEDNFEVVQEFGVWDREPDWNTNHGIRVLRKR